MKKLKKPFTIHYSLFTASKGQALVENILLLPMLCVMLSMILWFSRLLITRQQLLTAARYGTDMMVYTYTPSWNANNMRQEIKNYLSDPNIAGRRLNPAKLGDDRIRVNIYRYPKTNSGNAAMPVDFTTSSVEIYYNFRLPIILSNISKFFSGGASKGLNISARSEILVGTGSKAPNQP